MRNLTFALALVAQSAMLGTVGHVQAAGSPAQNAIQSGSAALQAGSFKAAIEQFTKGLATNSLDKQTAAITLLNRGLAHQRLGQYVEAMTDYDRALQNQALPAETRAVALYNRGLAHRKLYRTTLALEDFTNALILNPKFSQAYNSRANVLRELGYYTTAIQDYSSAVRYRHPQMHIPLYGKALSHAALRNLPAAATALKQALAIRPDYKPAKKLLARITTVPKQPEVPATDNTVIANNKNVDRITTGTVTDTTTVVAKNNLPWTPAPTERVTPAPAKPEVPPLRKPNFEDTVVAEAPAPVASTDVVASPTAAQASLVTQNVVPAPRTEDPSLRGSVTQLAPTTSSDDLPTPGLQLRTTQPEPELDTPYEPTAASTAQMASLDPSAVEQQPEPEAEVVPAPIKDEYLIQLSAQTDPEMARNLWNKLADKHSDILSDLTPYIIKVQIDGKGTIYRVRAGGFGDRKVGKHICKRLKRRRVTCYVTTAN